MEVLYVLCTLNQRSKGLEVFGGARVAEVKVGNNTRVAAKVPNLEQ